MEEEEKVPAPPYTRLSYLTRPFPDFDFSFIKPVRQKAVELLKLSPGGRVLDAGCGMGGSFPFLVKAVGSAGQVVGVEISEETCINARKRVERNGWKNVEVIEAAAQEVDLSGSFDGLLMFAAQDVFASAAALDNIFPYLKPNARIALFGAKIPGSRFGRVLGFLLQKIVGTLSPASPRLDPAPWTMLENRIGNMEVKEYFFGLMFLASGGLDSGTQL